MGNIVSKVPLKDGTVRYLADSEARTRVTTLETLLDGHSVQANVPQDAVFTDTVIQYNTLPAPSAEYAGQIYQYTGETDANFTNGHFYKCVEKIPTAKYTAPDGNTYKHKITGTGQSWYTAYTDKKICFVDDPAYYNDNGGVRVYKPFGISSPNCGLLETEERTNTAIFRSVYPSSGWKYDSNYRIFLTDSTVPSLTTEIWFPVSGNEETPVVSSVEAAYNYLTSPDLIYIWERVNVQNNILFGVCNTNRNIAEKVVSIPNLDKLVHGTQIRVLFDYPNVDHGSTMTTLNVNNLGAYQIVTKAGTLYQLPTWKSRVPVSFTFYEYPNDDPVWILEDLYEPTYVKDIGNDETIEGEYPELEEDIERYKQPGDIFKIYRNDTNDAYDFIAFKPTGWDEMYGTLTDAAEKADAAEQDLSTDTATVTGNPLNFTTLTAQKAKETVISLEPIQDLHGYDRPWPAGGGKNKLPMTVDGIKAANTTGTWSGNTYTRNDVSFTIQTNNGNNVIGILVNGTASANADFYLFGSFGSSLARINPDNYKVSSTPSDTSIIFGYSNSTVVRTDTTEQTITANNGISWAFVRIETNTTINNATLYPMIRLATETDATFAPYSNYCPIDGRTETSLVGTNGKESTDPDYIESNNLTIQFGETVYGAKVELEKGTVTVTWGYIASYNGETLPGEWISDRDVYAPNTSPSTGAEVAYELATPRTITLTPNEISLLSGVNNISTDGDSISLTYRNGKVATLADLQEISDSPFKIVNGALCWISNK